MSTINVRSIVVVNTGGTDTIMFEIDLPEQTFPYK
jgi:hypothetical protein